MSTDKLTQLQICYDQLLEQFCATLNYVYSSHTFIPGSETEPPVEDVSTTPAPKEEFLSTVDELSQDLIIKTRQILTLISSLPGIGVSAAQQIHRLSDLQSDLKTIEKRRYESIQKKNELLKWCDEIILLVANGISDS